MSIPNDSDADIVISPSGTAAVLAQLQTLERELHKFAGLLPGDLKPDLLDMVEAVLDEISEVIEHFQP